MKNRSIKEYTNNLLKLQIAVLIVFYLLRIFEFLYFKSKLIVPTDLPLFELLGFAFDTLFWSSYSMVLWLILLPFYKNKKAINITVILLGISFILINIGLQVFFVERGAPLDKELITNSLSNSITTVKSSNLINVKMLGSLIFLISMFVFVKTMVNKLNIGQNKQRIIIGLMILFAVINAFLNPTFFAYKYSANKTNFLVRSLFEHYTEEQKFQFSESQKFEIDEQMRVDIIKYQKQHNRDFVSLEYPLLRKVDTLNTLGPLFNLGDEKPNVVFLVVESLSRDICGPDAELGNFTTPFIDSLIEQSLFWENCLSSSAISFGMLPTSIGSLPYGQFGFSMLPKYPDHLSIVKVLRANNYHTSFITGAPMYFDNQGAFMRNQGTDYLSYHFPDKYSKMNQDNGWNWGYPDKVIFDFGIEKLDEKPSGPYMDTYVTIVTHPPYNFDEKEEFQSIFDKRLEDLDKSEKQKVDLKKIKDLLAAFIYTDESIKSFFNKYRQREDFNNTIFIVTGDHHGYFEPKNELGKFHVPLFIYSPLIKEPRKFSSLVTHHDIVPSILNLIDDKFNIERPEFEHWLGYSLDTNSSFQTKQSLPLMNWNKAMDYYVDNEYFLNKNKLYKILDNKLNITEIKDTVILNKVKNKLDVFRSVNAVCCYANAILPDTLLYKTELYDKIIFNEFIQDEIVSNKKYPSTFKAQLGPEQSNIKVEIEFEIILPKIQLDSLPKFVINIESDESNSRSYKDSKELSYLNNGDIRSGEWVKMTLVDYLKLDNVSQGNNMEFKAYFHNPRLCDLRIRNYSLRISTNK